VQSTPELYYTAREAQTRLGLSKAKFYKWVREGIVPRVVLPGMKQGVYPRRDVEALVSLMSAQQSYVAFSSSSPADMVEELDIAHKGLRHGT
jgi:predicted DNA-binding transcriptional regulator AlpA